MTDIETCPECGEYGKLIDGDGGKFNARRCTAENCPLLFYSYGTDVGDR